MAKRSGSVLPGGGFNKRLSLSLSSVFCAARQNAVLRRSPLQVFKSFRYGLNAPPIYKGRDKKHALDTGKSKVRKVVRAAKGVTNTYVFKFFKLSYHSGDNDRKPTPQSLLDFTNGPTRTGNPASAARCACTQLKQDARWRHHVSVYRRVLVL